MRRSAGWLLFMVTLALMVWGGARPALPRLQAQTVSPLTGQLVGRNGQAVPAQVTIHLTGPDGASNDFASAPDGSDAYPGPLEPGTYWLAVDYESLPDVLRAVLDGDDLASTPVSLPASEPVRLSLLHDLAGLGTCADIPLLFGTPSTAPVDADRQVINTLLPLLAMDDLYDGEAYNPLSRSALTIRSVAVDRNRHAIVMLEGEFAQSAEPCDAAYARAQIEQTVLSAGVRGVTVFVNNQLLDRLLVYPQ